MLFSRKDKNYDIKDVKEAIAKPSEPEYNNELDFTSELGPMSEDIPVVPERKEAPLFVKVEKYRDVISLIQEMKVFISGIKQLFNILQELENLRMDAIKIMKATIQRLERRVVEMDNELLRPKGFDVPELLHAGPAEPEESQVEDSLNELQDELAKLRKELEELK